MTTDTIHSRAMLVSLHISTWTARKFDRKITKKVNAQHAASRDAGRYNKMLLPGDADAFKTLLKAANAARTDHYANTLAWGDDGWRLLPSANYMKYTEIMRAHASTFGTALAEFEADYPELKEAAKALLNGMYKEADYPRAREIRGKFKFSTEFSPLPASGDFRLDLPAGEISAIETRVADRIAAATEEAVRDAWTRLNECVSKMHERLSEPGAIFRNSLVENARELVDVLDRLNVTNDAGLDAMRRRVEHELTIHEPETLRDAPDVRAETAKRAASILKDMSDVYGVTS